MLARVDSLPFGWLRAPLSRTSQRRHAFSSSSNYSASETVHLPLRSGRSITLDVHQPLAKSAPDASSPAAMVYLANGIAGDEACDEADISALRLTLPYPVVKINYTTGQGLRYPNAVHEVLAGYDWVREHLLPRRAITRPGRADHVGRVGVCGEVIGGALATMLALTECRIGEPGVAAAAVNNPLIDWVSLGRGPAHTAPLQAAVNGADFEYDSDTLRAVRATAFRKPEDYFDPFASPILFLRSAGAEVPPPTKMPPDELELLSQFEREDFFREQQALSAVTTVTADLEPSPGPEPKSSRRKASRNFPSRALGLRLPAFRISCTDDDDAMFHSQSHELTRLLRKSVIRQNVQAATAFGRKVFMPDEEDQMEEDERLQHEAWMWEAEKKVSFYTSPVNAKWDVNAVARWFKDVLG